MDGFAARLAILFSKIWQFQPANQRPCAYAGRACCLLDVSLRQERGNRVFLFTPEFFAVSCHLMPSDAIWRRSARNRLSFAGSDSLHNSLALPGHQSD